MIVRIIYNMPNWLLALVVVAITVAFAILGLLAVRAVLRGRSREMSNEIVIGLGHQVGVIYAIVVGFVAIGVLSAYDKANGIVENEANQAFTIWVDARVYPADFELKVRNAVEDYLHVVIHDEWPVQDQGRTSLIASRSFEYLYRLIIDYAPTSEAQGIVHREIIQKVNKIFEDRRDRAFMNVHGLQPTVYCEIFLATLILLGFAWAFSAKKLQGHLTLTAMLGVAIGLVIFLIVVFDYPFRGYFSVTTECYQEALDHLARLKIEQPPSSGI